MAAEVKKQIQLEIAHVLFIDIVGYSKLLIDEQREVLEELNQIVRETKTFREAEAAEKLIRLPTGDGMALVFSNTPEAPVECALEISRALKSRPHLRVRMGAHSGPVSGVMDVNNRVNVAGAGINTAQRVMNCADAGHILLSKRVAEDLAQYRQWNAHLHDLGECEVKHNVRLGLVNLYTDEVGNPEIPDKFKFAQETATASSKRSKPWLGIGTLLVVLLLISLAVVAVVFAPAILKQVGTPLRGVPNPEVGRPGGPSLPVTEKSIAVLPFENRSEDKANAYFADGVQDEILTRLSKIADLKVISRTSTQHYKSAPENLPQIAKQLGVAHILEGSVQKSADAVRINVQLIKAANDSHLWAETFDRKLTDIFAVESEVAKSIADQLRAKLTGHEERVIASRSTENPQAYDAYLRGLAYSLKTGFSPSNAVDAQKYLREATKLDPKFARAWALLSYVDSYGYITAFLQPTEALREETRQAAATAIALDPDLGEAVLAQAYYQYSCLKDYDAAERYLEQARRLLPNSNRIPEMLAYITRRRGQWNESENYFRQAQQLDPRNPALLSQHAFSYIHLRRFKDAERLLDAILDITPDDLDSTATKAAIAQCEGDLTRAAAILAPLRPSATNAIVVERQVYQSILERHPAPMIPRLQEILAQSDPALGYFNGELRLWLGWAQDLAGDHTSAVATWQRARDELHSLLASQPENHFLIGDLALIHMLLGDTTGARSMVDRGFAVNPPEHDAIAGPRSIEVLARVAAGTGQSEQAITALEKLLAMPVSGLLDRSMPLTSALLRLDPMFDPLRNDPRFQKLAGAPAAR